MSTTSTGINRHTVLQSVTRGLTLCIAFGLVLGLIGPFDTFSRMGLAERLAFWTASIAAGMLVHFPLYWAAIWTAGETRLSPWIMVVMSGLVAAAPTTLMVNGVAAAMFGNIRLDGFAELYPMVLAISLPAQILTHLAIRRLAEQAESPISGAGLAQAPASVMEGRDTGPVSGAAEKQVAPAGPGPATTSQTGTLIAALPARLGRQITCLQMEDHYVRVFTPSGSAMVHRRMADAAVEVESLIEGMRVHRSWWVAREAVTGWARDGKTLTLQLSTGQSVPVARDRQPLVRAAGWLV